MIPQVRILVRLMDRVRLFDEFEMTSMEHRCDTLAGHAGSCAMALAARSKNGPCMGALSRTAATMVRDQIQEDDVSVRTALFEDGWLLLIRLDRRTGPALDLHPDVEGLMAA